MPEDLINMKNKAENLIANLESKFKVYNDILINQSRLSGKFYQGFKEIGTWIKIRQQSTSKLIKRIRQIEKQINEIIKTVELISGEASRLSEYITRVGELIDRGRQIIKNKEQLLNQITATASEVDTLARNAEIKSYHAGEEGRGFGVVAREMAQLALDVGYPVKSINSLATEITNRFSIIEKNVEQINRFKEIASGLSTTLRKIGNDGIILLPFLRKSLAHIDHCLTDLNRLTMNLERTASEIEMWSNQAVDAWERDSITINQFVGITHKLKELINPIFKERLSKNLRLYPLQRLSIHGGAKINSDEMIGLLNDISLIQNDQTQALGELKEKVNDWRDFLKELSRQFLNSKTEYGNLTEASLEVGDINKKIRDLTEAINELDFIFEKAKLLSLYARIEAVRPSEDSGLLPVSEGMKALSEKVSQNSLDLKLEIGKLVGFVSSLSENFIKINTQITRLSVDSEESIDFFNIVTDHINSLSETIANSETELKTIDISELARIGRELTEGLNQLAEMKLEDDIEAIMDFSRQLHESVRSWPAVVTRECTLKIGMVGRPILLDPGHRTDANSHRINIMIFKGLYQIDQKNNILPSIASSADLSPDGKVWTFHLHRGIKFHNGQELKARDVVNTFQHMLKGPNRAFVEMISGSKDFQTGNKKIISGISVIDDYTIQIRLDYPYLPFLSTIASGACDIIPEEFNPQHPVGAGPYKYVDWTGHIIKLSAFDDYAEGRPLIKNIEIHLLPAINDGVELYNQDELDIIPLTTEFASMIPEDEILAIPLLTFRYIGINLRADTPLKDLRLRQAMHMAIDRERFVNECLGGWGTPAFGIFPPSLSVYNPDIKRLVTYDPDRARQIVSELGLDQPLELDVYDNESAIRRAEWLSRELLKIGIRLEIKPRDNLLEWTYRGKSILSLKGWLSDTGDPDNFLFPIFHSASWGRTGNTSFYSNKEVDELIERARTVRNKIERDELYRVIEQKILEDLPAIPLTHNYSGYAVKPRVKGFIPDPFDVIKPANMWIR
ncbi:MAG TPA: hypothetical protein EYP58_05845 [bacterium (Candidatus Stahlbacteria)]|nr:hypothetical protein [Candidatus Stahlbacteria bacterium]